jgi:hypothetical protein
MVSARAAISRDRSRLGTRRMPISTAPIRLRAVAPGDSIVSPETNRSRISPQVSAGRVGVVQVSRDQLRGQGDSDPCNWALNPAFSPTPDPRTRPLQRPTAVPQYCCFHFRVACRLSAACEPRDQRCSKNAAQGGDRRVGVWDPVPHGACPDEDPGAAFFRGVERRCRRGDATRKWKTP